MIGNRRRNGIRTVLFAVCIGILISSGSPPSTADTESVSLGLAALRSGDYDSARQHFEASLDDAEGRSGLIRTLRVTGEYREAADRLEDFLSAHPDSASLLLEAGNTYKLLGDYSKAEAFLKRAVSIADLSQTRIEAIRTLAELLSYVGRENEARQWWNSLIGEYRRGNLADSRSLGAVAVAAWRLGDVYDARDIFLDATDIESGESPLTVISDFGYLFMEKYNFTEAMVSFKDCLKINGSYPDALIGMARAKKYESDFEVEIYARAALEINPNLVAARNLLAGLALDAEYYEAALDEIEAALSINPVDLESLSLLATHYFLHGDMVHFETTEEKVLAVNPFYGKFYHILAENLVSRRKYREAVDFSRKAINLNPQLWPAYITLGLNLTRIGDLGGGRAAIEQAFEGDPFNVWAINSLDLLDQMDTFVERRSDHFIYRMSEEDGPVLTSYTARLAEEVYENLTRRYGFHPEGPISVEIFPDHGGFAVRTLGLPGLGGALGVCFGKVIAMDSPRARQAGTSNWGSTLWHEFTHVISLQMSNHNIPRWFSEGISVFEEYKARPGWGDGIDLSFIRAYKKGTLLKASELNQGFTRPESPEQIALAYVQAALVCQWMEETYGFESIRQSLLLFAENTPSEEVFLRTIGLEPAEMDAEYARYVDRRVQEIADSVQIDTDNRPVRITAEADQGTSNLPQRLKENPDDFFANLLMGTLLQKEGKLTEAEVYLRKAQQLFPQYIEPGNPYQLLAQIYMDTQKEDAAVAQFEQWIRMDYNAREPLLKVAEIYDARKEWDNLARVLGLHVYIHPYDVESQKKLGKASLESGRWDLAIAAYQALAELNTTDPAAARFDLAIAYRAAGDLQKAKRETIRSLEIAPAYREAQKLLLELVGDEPE